MELESDEDFEENAYLSLFGILTSGINEGSFGLSVFNFGDWLF